jgi:hypothetical protein
MSLWLVVVVVTTTAVAVVTVGAVVVVAIGAEAVEECKLFLKHYIIVKPCQPIVVHVCNMIFQQGKPDTCYFVTFNANTHTGLCYHHSYFYLFI